MSIKIIILIHENHFLSFLVVKSRLHISNDSSNLQILNTILTYDFDKENLELNRTRKTEFQVLTG